jgi:YidC/Oxa1 family membrane protein insertase
MDTRRLILFVIFSFSILMLWDSWQQKNRPITPAQQEVRQEAQVPGGSANITGVTATNNVTSEGSFKLEKGQRIKVATDLFQAEIDTVGGDLRHLVLNKHRAAEAKDGNFVLMDDAQNPMLYVAQTGLMGGDLPNHKSLFTSAASSYTLADGAASQEVRLSWVGNGVSDVIDVTYQINNGSAAAIAPSTY